FIPELDLLNNINKSVISRIESTIKDEPALTITEGNIIKEGFNEELDEIKNAEKHGKTFIQNLQAAEIEKTGISTLKVRFNKVFGYYIEVSKANADKVPDNYIRKQTLVNAERYITDELKVWEEKILGAEEKAAGIEYQIFEELRQDLVNEIENIQEVIAMLSIIDVLTNFANIAYSKDYVKPSVSDELSDTSSILGGRHPVVESFSTNEFIPNDLEFIPDQQQLIILTGPNMSGKSTYIRQNALIQLMAQIGSYVPASRASLVIADRIFTRVGASDNLAAGESTFMVEMNETANILNNATSKSLLILDEVGRGTSTYDGVAIAWSIVEYLASKVKARTLFATHYHELMQLEEKFSNIKNFNVDVKESDGKILFMRKIVKGGTDQSYGIHVADIAGLPKEVIKNANKILQTLEEEQIDIHQKKVSTDQLFFTAQPQGDEFKDQLKEIDVNLITPIDALKKLEELSAKARNS
ncbi:DNA mismatch repair protein MutS, partial [Candidatus Dojkabacteria bacterium]|nr:DNA mismatch repair protein MutS [Candidatus Dojkabacteria bacterium]